MTCLYLVRHGATDAIGVSFTGRISGVGLNASGKQQADTLAGRFSGLEVRAIFSSPSDRARQTAETIAARLGIPVQERIALDEIAIGDWSGMAFDDLNRTEEFQLFNSMRSLSRPPAGELMLEVQSRAVGELLRIAGDWPEGTVVVVTHADVIKSVLAYFLGMPLDLTHRLTIDLASVSVVELSSSHVQVVKINC